MTLLYKIRIGLGLLWRTPGLQPRLRLSGQLATAALWSRRHRPTRVDDTAAAAWAEVHLLSFVTRSVNLRLDNSRPARLVAIVPELNPEVIFGGYIAFFQFLAFWQARGVAVDLLVLKPDPRTSDPQAFAANPLAHAVLKAATVRPLGTARTIVMGPKDAIVAYNWTTALIAGQIARQHPCGHYHYFVQEDERVFYAHDSHRFLVESLFHDSPKPQLICNSAKLADSLARDGLTGPGSQVAVFEQAIPRAVLPSPAELAARRRKRFVFYGRPEDHARRNLFSVALLALRRAADMGAFSEGSWEICMIGSGRMGRSFTYNGLDITALPNQGYDAYRQALTGFDAGMALMAAPHPSVPPFEMVRSGIVTVVNTTPARPADWYNRQSGNFEPAPPTVEGLAAALCRATARTSDVVSRLDQAHSPHPETWEASLAAMAQHLSHPLFVGARRGRIVDHSESVAEASLGSVKGTAALSV